MACMNAVLVILDSLRRDHVGCYGNGWIRTPNLDAFAKQGCIFDRAFPESLPTIPVRRALHTGKRTFPFRGYEPVKGDHVKVYGWQPIPEDQVTLSEILRHHGYRTAFITDTYHQFKPSMNFHRGFDEWRWIRGQESDAYNSKLADEIGMHLSSSGKGNSRLLRRYLANIVERKTEKDYFAPKVFREAVRWLTDNGDAEKFFLCIDSFDPHEPWDPPQSYVDLYDPGYQCREVITPMYTDWHSYLTEDELRHMRALYAGEVTMVDAWFGRFMNALDDRGRQEDTLVVVISDHGHQLGEHGPTGKVPEGLHPELMDIPLIIREPTGQGGRKRLDPFVYNHDVFPTILSYLGISPPDHPDGMDLAPLIRGETDETRPYVTSGFSDYAWIRDDDFVLIRSSDGNQQILYDLGTDPEQQTDVSSEQPDQAQRLTQLLLADAGGQLPDYRALIRRRLADWYES